MYIYTLTPPPLYCPADRAHADHGDLATLVRQMADPHREGSRTQGRRVRSEQRWCEQSMPHVLLTARRGLRPLDHNQR